MALGDELGGLIHRVAQAWQRQAGRALRPTGLTYSQFQLLAALAKAPGFTQAGLARQAGIDAMTASIVLRNLERRRYVARRISEADSRARFLTLTESGVAVLTRAQALAAEAEATFFAGVAGQRRELAGVLGALIGEKPRVRVAMGRGAPA